MNDENQVIASRQDWFVIAALLLFSVVAWIMHQYDSASLSPRHYLVRVLTDPVQQLVFKEPQKLPVQVTGRIGTAEIEWDSSGRVRIASSTCPCKTCVNMGWSANASLICVPNGIIVEVVPDKAIFDAVSQ